MASYVKKQWLDLIHYLSENDSEEMNEYMKTEYAPFYQFSGSCIFIGRPSGQVLFGLFFTLTLAMYLFHNIFGAVSALVAYSCNLEYSCIIGYATLNGFWATTLFVSQFTHRPNFNRLYFLIKSKFFAYDYEIETQSEYRKLLRAFHIILRDNVKYVPLSIVACDIVYVCFMPTVKCDNELLQNELYFPTYYPFEVRGQVGIIIANFFQMYYMVNVIVFACGGLFFFINSTLHWMQEMLRLIESVENIEERAIRLFLKRTNKKDPRELRLTDMDLLYMFKNDEFVDCYSYCLKENIKHHQVLTRFQYYFQQNCELPMGTVLALSSVVIALLLVVLTDQTFFGSVIVGFCLLLVTFAGIFTATSIGQTYLDLAEDLRQSIFETKWHYGDKRITSLVVVFMEVTKNPIRPAAYGFLPYDRPAFLVALNVAYSYWNFLKLLQSFREN